MLEFYFSMANLVHFSGVFGLFLNLNGRFQWILLAAFFSPAKILKSSSNSLKIKTFTKKPAQPILILINSKMFLIVWLALDHIKFCNQLAICVKPSLVNFPIYKYFHFSYQIILLTLLIIINDLRFLVTHINQDLTIYNPFLKNKSTKLNHFFIERYPKMMILLNVENCINHKKHFEIWISTDMFFTFKCIILGRGAKRGLILIPTDF